MKLPEAKYYFDEENSFEILKDGGTAEISFISPKLDFYEISNMENEVIKEFSDCNKIIYNMKNVEFIASAFIRLCLEAIQVVGQDNFEIINANKFIRTVLKISKFDTFVKVSK